MNGHLQESTLDQLLSSNMHLIESVETHAPLGRSDHLIIEATLSIANDVDYLVSAKRNWSKCDEAKVETMGENTNWDFNGADWDIEGMWEDLHSKMIAISNACTPIKKIKTTNGLEIRKLCDGISENV